MKEFLTEIYEDFKRQEENWCDITKSQFTYSQNIDFANKNYDVKVIEQFYLLKFMPLYIHGYYKMYQDFLKLYKKSSLRILSIGVGAGLDYFGLCEALEDEELEVDYLGIDLVDWTYRDQDIDFVQIDLKDIKGNKKVMDFIGKGIDVVVFPKSIIEIPNETLLHFSNILIESSIDDIWLLNSFIKNSKTVNGIDEFNTVIINMEQNGYEYIDKHEIYFNSTSNSKINYSYLGIDYKSTWFSDIKNHCHGKCSESQIAQCKIAEHYPMLSQKYMAHGISNLIKVA